MCVLYDLRRCMFRTGSIYNGLRHTRSFLNVEALNDQSTPHWRLLQRLMQAGMAAAVAGLPIKELPSYELQALHQLHRQGRLGVSEDGKLYRMPSPLHWRYCQHQLQQYRCTDVDAAKPTSMEAFLQLVLPRMSASRLRTALRDGTVLEDRYQPEFATAALSVRPIGHNICPEVQGASVSLVDVVQGPCWSCLYMALARLQAPHGTPSKMRERAATR